MLDKLVTLEELDCDEKLEEHVLSERATRGFLPNLKLLNGLPLSLTDKEQRATARKCTEVANKLQFLARVYSISHPGQIAAPIWYLMDEVGSSI